MNIVEATKKALKIRGFIKIHPLSKLYLMPTETELGFIIFDLDSNRIGKRWNPTDYDILEDNRYEVVKEIGDEN